jgi:hypothetical protein
VEVDSQTVAISVRRNRTLSEVAGTTYAMIDIHQLRQQQLGPPRLHWISRTAPASRLDIGSGTDAGSRHITTPERRYSDYTLNAFGRAIIVARALMASLPGLQVHAIKTANALGDDFFRVEFQRVGALDDRLGSIAVPAVEG